MADSSLCVERSNGVLHLTINRETARNALNDVVIKALRKQLQEAELDRDLRAVVLTGVGERAFCAGADLKPSQGTFIQDPSIPNTDYADLLRAAASCPVPLIARVNGHCIAGGMGLLAMCDMAIASSSARFGLPEVKVGVFPMQVASLLQHLIPRRKLDELCITGELIDADHALEIGLLNYVVAPTALDETLSWLLDRVVSKSPTAIRRGKYALQAIRDMSVPQAMAYMESQIISMAQTEDAREGLAAFNEKRPPQWTGR